MTKTTQTNSTEKRAAATDQSTSAKIKKSLEGKVLIVLLGAFVFVMFSAWGYALKLSHTVAANNAVMNVNPNALIEVEKLRNLVESQFSDSRSFFLLGSRFLFDNAKKQRQTFSENLASFEKSYSLPALPEITKRIEAVLVQHQDIFEQAMKFREKQTESKIVGQFYQSKTSPMRTQINAALDEIVTLHNAELEKAKEIAATAAHDSQVMIPRGMAWLTALIGVLFAAMTLLVIQVLRERVRQIAERDRLYTEASSAVLARDEILAAIVQDFKSPLSAVAANALAISKDKPEIAELLRNAVNEIESAIADISDQKKADMGSLSLRLDQLGIDEILDEALHLLKPVAKQKDVRLEFDSVNPPVLAFFDRERVIRILWNLVGNAIKFSPRHSKVVVKVRSDAQYVFISVADVGTGIEEKQIAGIFENFWQAKKTAEQGPGVGLAVVKTIVEAHGGTVKAENNFSKGTTFTFSLPRRRPVGANLRKPTNNVRQRTRSPMAADILGGPAQEV